MAEETVKNLILELNTQTLETERKKRRIQLLKYYYFLPESEKVSVEHLIEPYLRTDIPFEKDALILEAEALLSRIEARVAAQV